MGGIRTGAGLGDVPSGVSEAGGRPAWLRGPLSTGRVAPVTQASGAGDALSPLDTCTRTATRMVSAGWSTEGGRAGRQLSWELTRAVTKGVLFSRRARPPSVRAHLEVSGGSE